MMARLALLWLLLVPVLDAHASVAIEVGDRRVQVKQVPILFDRESTLSIDAVAANPDAFQLRETNLGYQSGAVWLRLDVRNASAEPRWFLRIGEPRLGSVELFLPTVNGWERQRSGTLVPVSERTVVHRDHLFELELPPGSELRVFLRLESPTTIAAELSLWTPAKLLAQTQHSSLYVGALLGAAAGVGLYLLIVFVVMREAIHAWFTLAFFACFSYIAAYEGLFHLYLQRVLGDMALTAILLSGGIVGVAMLGYCRHFLELPARYPRCDRVVRLTLACLLLLLPLGIVIFPYQTAAQLINGSAMLVAMVMLLVGVRVALAGFRPAWIFLLILAFFWLVVIYSVLELYSLVPVQLESASRLSASLVLLPLMAFGFAYRQRLLKIERDAAEVRRLQEKREMVQRLENEVHRRTMEAEQVLAVATAASSAKDDFLATMTHELRTPLTTMLGAADLLEHGELNMDQSRLVEAQRKAGHHLLSLVEDILDLARIEQGAVQLADVPFRPQALLRDLETMFRPEAEAAGLVLRLELGPMPFMLRGDPQRIRQVIANLVVNAIKYTEVGGVVIHASASSELEGEMRLTIAVEDTGIGMDKRMQRLAFQPFERGDVRGRGAGLGLAIVARLVSVMGGNIGVESWPRLGSRFEVTLPLKVSDAAVIPRTQRCASPKSLLLVEDVPENREIVRRLLEREGHSVIACGRADEAFPLIEAHHFDAILLDLGLPDIDGTEVAKSVRAGSSGHESMPRLIALTAQATTTTAKRCRDAGFDALLIKPLDVRHLNDALDGKPVMLSEHLPTPRLTRVRMGMNQDDWEVLQVKHRETCVEVATALRDALAADDLPAMAKAAHRLAGSAATMGRSRLAEQARKAQLGVESDDSEAVRELLVMLEGTVYP